jgi:hypothetical protein
MKTEVDRERSIGLADLGCSLAGEGLPRCGLAWWCLLRRRARGYASAPFLEPEGHVAGGNPWPPPAAARVRACVRAERGLLGLRETTHVLYSGSRYGFSGDDVCR